LAGLELGNDAVGVFWILEQPRHIAHEDQAPGLEGDGGLGRRHIGIAIINPPVLAAGRGADDRRDAPLDTFPQRRGVYAGDLADITEVPVLAGSVLKPG